MRIGIFFILSLLALSSAIPLKHELCNGIKCELSYRPGQVRKTWLKIAILSCCREIRQQFLNGSKDINKI